MTEATQTLEILKQAILLEKRGHAFYHKVAEQTDDSATKEFFELMAAEETKHMAVLGEQYKMMEKNGRFDASVSNISDTGVIITDALSATGSR